MRRLALFLLLALAACGRDEAPAKGGQRRAPMAFPVEVRPVESARVEYVVGAVGSVEAFEKVQVTSRVAGVIEKVRFREGDNVTAGQVLAEIEPERFRLSVTQAEAALERAQAGEAEAVSGLARREAAEKENPGLIRGEELETWRTRARTAAADVSAARAAAERARLEYRDAFVRATAPGVIDTRNVQTGQWVQPGAVLATLVRRDPLLLRFSVTEEDAARIFAGMQAKFRSKEARDFSAKITHVAQAADEKTRMVHVTAEVVPADRESLRPGTFAEVSVGVGNALEAPVIPQTAIRPSEKGFVSYVIVDGVAKERILDLGMRTADGRVEVRKGLVPGELLVVRGAEALRDGAGVRVVEGPSTDTAEKKKDGDGT